MFNDAQAHEWWANQAEMDDNPCHYHDKWQDGYAFRVRTQAFQKSDFNDAGLVVDVGCGIGEYTEALSRLTNAHFIGFDFPFNVELARKRSVGNSQLEFKDGALPNEAVREALKSADVAFTTTVYVHLAPDARKAFYDYIAAMKQGSRFLLLEYMPDRIPEFQKKVPTKQVETLPEIKAKFEFAGFALKEVRGVNFIDSLLFFHLGKNAFSYYLTLVLERFFFLAPFVPSKYKLLVFEKR